MCSKGAGSKCGHRERELGRTLTAAHGLSGVALHTLVPGLRQFCYAHFPSSDCLQHGRGAERTTAQSFLFSASNSGESRRKSGQHKG